MNSAMIIRKDACDLKNYMHYKMMMMKTDQYTVKKEKG